jgi:hypothetical protein
MMTLSGVLPNHQASSVVFGSIHLQNIAINGRNNDDAALQGQMRRCETDT